MYRRQPDRGRLRRIRQKRHRKRTGKKLSVLLEKAVKFVRRYAEENSFKCIDLARCKAFTDENEPVMQPNDGLHYSEVGYGIMAVYIKNALKELNII